MMAGAVIMWRWHTLIGVLQTLLLFTAPIFGQYQDGDVRLVGGSYQWEGRVEIYFSSTWGTITDSEWTNNDAQVVCRKMGHFKPGATAHSNAYFGEGKGTIHLDSVQCSGSEYIVTDCETKRSQTSNSHSFDVGVKCQPADEAYREGDIRLVGGPHDWEGRVEIFWFGSWGTISDSSWSVENAIVVCRQLQHSSGNGLPIPCCERYEEGDGSIHIRDVTCVGSEKTITSCSYFNNTVRTSHQLDVMVQCEQGDEVKEGDIRIIGRHNIRSQYIGGSVQIFLFGAWGSIYRYGANTNTAKVVCRQLGYKTNLITSVGCCLQNDVTIRFNNLYCNGLEHRVPECQYDNFTTEYPYSWGVYCYIDGPELYDVNLQNTYSGYVQVYIPGSWLRVGNTGSTWTEDNSKVVCRELGYSTNETSWNSLSYSTSSARMDYVYCNGNEEKLKHCSYDVVPVVSNTAVTVTCQYNRCSVGDMRLSGGNTEAEGRVEVCRHSYGSWGTVCDKQWTDNNTAVVCRYLGFSDIIGDSDYFAPETFGRGSGPIVMDYVNCTGSEARLWGRCNHFTHYYGCSHDDDVGIRCRPASCSDGQLRLIYDHNDYYGRVEICSDQRWETLNYYQWSSFTARVVCIELGYSSYSSWRRRYGSGGGPIHPKYYECTGADQRLSQCNGYNDTTIRTHSDDVGMVCLRDGCPDGEVRLIDGETEWEGRLEVCFNRRWGTVGSEGWSQVNTDVVCNDLGYDTTDEKVDESIPVALSKPVYLHNIRCTSRDLTLLDCGYTRYNSDTKTMQDVIIKCQQPTCKDGDIKLVGGASEFEGRLEICFGQRWTTIDGNGWTHTDTEVACSELGLPTSDVSYTTTDRTRYTIGQSLRVSMTLVGCYSSDEHLIDCGYHDFPSTTSTSMDVSISCQSNESTIESINGSTQLSSASTASLTIAVICAIAVAIMVAILIVMFLLRRRKRKNDPSVHRNTELATHGHDSESGSRYSTSKFTTTTGNKSLDDKKVNLEDDIPMDSYEEMEAPNVVPLPPKPRPKKAPKKPTVAKNVDPTRYKNPSAPKPAMARPPMHLHHPGRFQQQPRPPSPEAIYEVPD